jgi:putative Holliday junction resolvase
MTSADRRSDDSAAALPASGCLLAIDLGDKRIGLAASDPTQLLAHPVDTLTRRVGKRFPLKQLRDHLDRHRPVGIVIGLPLESDGSEGTRAHEARDIAALLAQNTGLPTVMVDERMTTARALRAVREMGGTTRGRKGEVDRLAATTLLQSFLDGRRR